jgi:hypothetical protein
VLPFLKEEEAAKAKAALEGVTEQTRKNIVNALCAASVSEKRLRSIKAYIEMCPPKAATPDASKEPALTDTTAQAVAGASAEQIRMAATNPQVIAFAKQYGFTPERAAELMNVSSVDQLK